MALGHPTWEKIKGIINGYLKFGFNGPHVEKDAADPTQLNILANNGVADAKIKVATTRTVTIEVWDAALSKKTTITLPEGAAADLLAQLPTTAGNEGDVLATNGAGVLSWRNAGGHADVTTHKYPFTFATGSPFNLLNMLAAHRILRIVIDIETAFDGSNPDICCGVSGTIEKFTEKKDSDLKNVGTYGINVELTQASAAQMIATLNIDGSTAGAGTIYVWSAEPA